jgi:hypothetical protein
VNIADGVDAPPLQKRRSEIHAVEGSSRANRRDDFASFPVASQEYSNCIDCGRAWINSWFITGKIDPTTVTAT